LNTVARELPFHSTTEVAVNPVPVAVSVKPEPPAAIVLGEMELSDGTGLFTV
jgi:hypothetical protein